MMWVVLVVNKGVKPNEVVAVQCQDVDQLDRELRTMIHLQTMIEAWDEKTETDVLIVDV